MEGTNFIFGSLKKKAGDGVDSLQFELTCQAAVATPKGLASVFPMIREIEGEAFMPNPFGGMVKIGDVDAVIAVAPDRDRNYIVIRSGHLFYSAKE